MSHSGGDGTGEPRRDGNWTQPLGEETAGSNYFVCLSLQEVKVSLCVHSVFLPPCSSPEWGHDRLPHTEQSLFSADSGHHGGHRMVSCQLQHGTNAGLGPRPRLWLRHEELQVLDGQTEREVTVVLEWSCWRDELQFLCTVIMKTDIMSDYWKCCL